MTARTHRVLTAIADLSGAGQHPNNLEVSQAAGVRDQGQISKLLARLQHHGLLENTGGHPATGNAWQITKRGAELLATSRASHEGAGR